MCVSVTAQQLFRLSKEKSRKNSRDIWFFGGAFFFSTVGVMHPV